MPEASFKSSTDDLVRRGLKFSQLRLLAALRDRDQIGAAAQHVGMTQPAASRLLAQLDALIGTPLYVRHPRGITLTDAGRILADQAKETLKGLDRAQERLTQVGQGTRGHVRVGTVTGPSLELMLPVMQKARDAYPEISLSVRVEPSDQLSEALLSDDLDFYVGRIPATGDRRPFEIDVIGPEPISLLVRLDHPLSRRGAPRLEACLDYDWVLQPPGGILRQTAESYLLAHGLPLPKRIVSTTSILFTLALVNETNAIAPLASSVAAFFTERAALGSRLAALPVAEDMAVSDYGIVSRSGDAPTPATERILSLLRAEVHRQRAV